MKKNIIYTLIAWFVASSFLSAFLGGCTRRDFEEEQPAGNVSLNFNWKNLGTNDTLPSGMQLYFYSSDGTILMRESQASGFTGTLPTGIYQVLAYNTDGKNVEQRNLTSYEGAEVYAPVYTRASSYLYQPSHSYGVGLGTLTVVEGESSSATMVPRNFVRQAVIRLEAGEYASQISRCSGTLSGFSTGAYISSGELLAEGSNLYFESEEENTSFVAGVSFFGKNVNEDNILHLDLAMAAGSTQFLTVDITDELKDVNVVQVDVEVDVTVDVLNSEVVLSSVTIKPRDEVNGGGGEVH